jgi:hypothetical protein
MPQRGGPVAKHIFGGLLFEKAPTGMAEEVVLLRQAALLWMSSTEKLSAVVPVFEAAMRAQFPHLGPSWVIRCDDDVGHVSWLHPCCRVAVLPPAPCCRSHCAAVLPPALCCCCR